MVKPKRPKYGELNTPAGPTRGISIDTEDFADTDLLAEVVSNIRRPKFTDRLSGPLKGIVISQESTLGTNKKGNSWLSWYWSKEEETPQLVQIRVRIPELHAHLPDPLNYLPGDNFSRMLSLYPVFIATNPSIEMPNVGEIVWVDFGDRENFEDPIYIGRLENKTKEPGINRRENISALGVAKNSFGGLGLAAPPGTPLAESTLLKIEGQEPISRPRYTPKGKVGERYVVCRDTANPLSSYPRCPQADNEAGEHLISVNNTSTVARGDFIELGRVQMNKWQNRNNSSKLVRADIEHTLMMMEEAFLKENNLESGDLKQYINDGYRSFARAACFYEKYRVCLREWKKNGANPSEQPKPVAPPGTSKHSSGLATDFNKGYIKKKGYVLWKWLQSNSTRFGWVWAGANFNPQEAWHYEFNEMLATEAGIFPKTK